MIYRKRGSPISNQFQIKLQIDQKGRFLSALVSELLFVSNELRVAFCGSGLIAVSAGLLRDCFTPIDFESRSSESIIQKAWD
jgi:hypothetical protein